MNSKVISLVQGIDLSGSIETASRIVFQHYGHVQNAEHSYKVAQKAKQITQLFGLDEYRSSIAGYLHDISEIIPHEHMAKWAKELGINTMEEELDYPIILHQRLSKVLVKEIFNVQDDLILSAIECHTTLKAAPSPYDMILFISDKIAWDKKYNEHFINDVLEGLNKSLEHACLGYLRYLMKNRTNLKVLHPWTLGAYNYLSEKCRD